MATRQNDPERPVRILEGDRFECETTGVIATVLLVKPGRVYVDRSKGGARWYGKNIFKMGYVRL